MKRHFSWRRNLYITWIVQILSLAGFGFVLPFLPYYIQTLGITDATTLKTWVGILSSVTPITMALMAPIWGILSDRYGKKLSILRAMLSATVILSCMALSSSIYTILILRLIQGLLTGTVTAATTLVASGTPKKHQSYALGFLSSSTFIGYAAGPFLGGIFAESFGYRLTFLTGGGLLLFGFFLALTLIRETNVKTKTYSPTFRIGNLRALLTGKLVYVFLMALLLRSCRSLIAPFLPLYVQYQRGTIVGSARITGIISALMGLAAAISGITIARQGDRYSKIGLTFGLIVCAIVLSFPLFFSSGLLIFSIFIFATYLFLGSVEPVTQSYLSTIIPREKTGVVFGLQTTAGSFGWFLAPMIGSLVAIIFSVKHVFLLFSFQLIVIGVVTGIAFTLSKQRTAE